MEQIEWAMREAAQSIGHLVQTLKENEDEYDARVPDCLHNALVNLMQEIQRHFTNVEVPND